MRRKMSNLETRINQWNRNRGNSRTNSWNKARPPQWSNRRSSGFEDRLWTVFQRGERWLIRGLILGTLLLVFFQYGLAKDPVQFFLAMGGPLDTMTMDTDAFYATNAEPKYVVTFRSAPAASVRIIQNGVVLGTLDGGEVSIEAAAGKITLDSTNVSNPVRVQVMKTDPALAEPMINQIITLEHNSITLNIVP